MIFYLNQWKKITTLISPLNCCRIIWEMAHDRDLNLLTKYETGIVYILKRFAIFSFNRAMLPLQSIFEFHRLRQSRKKPYFIYFLVNFHRVKEFKVLGCYYKIHVIRIHFSKTTSLTTIRLIFVIRKEIIGPNLFQAQFWFKGFFLIIKKEL